MDLIYLNRISTDNKEQDETSNLITCENWAKANNHSIKFKLIDKGVSGSIPYYERPEAKKILDIIAEYKRKNKELGILVFSIDRFSREHPVRAMANKEDLNERGIRIFSVTEPAFNDDNEFSLIIQFNLFWFGYYFLKQHSKKVKAGNEKRKQEGKHLGRALIKEVIGTGKNKEYIYYSPGELEVIHNTIRELHKKYSYRQIENRMMRLYNVNVSISYISKVINEK